MVVHPLNYFLTVIGIYTDDYFYAHRRGDLFERALALTLISVDDYDIANL
ncbi:MAG: hypothetical protein N5P05_002106 [Chroococcopsis gigantea SAG 12.99]|jgi:hypothetical protein|nr:hypothetical protein [Chlorogloea purpurea SAG 13.99]MDV3000500.1 hypothetical protein [Chroococcopsis gigantea SAG 12.99]